MKQRPILFSAPMVRALLDGTKTQTRRVVKHAPTPWNPAHTAWDMTKCSHGKAGDQLWVREAWRVDSSLDKMNAAEIAAVSNIPGIWIQYEARPSVQLREPGRYRQGRFMPRWASRITLEITGVRVERLQDITAADALAEGIVNTGDDNGFQLADTTHYINDPRESYASLWETINGDGSWDSNPWVWVIEFKKI